MSRRMVITAGGEVSSNLTEEKVSRKISEMEKELAYWKEVLSKMRSDKTNRRSD